MDYLISLGNLGLTKVEAKVYLELLKIGSTKTGPLVKKTGLHRATVYDVLKRLIEKGLVNYITKENTKHFQAIDPHSLLDLLKEEQIELDNKKNNAIKIISDLNKLKSEAMNKEEAHVFFGKRGVKTIYESILKHKEVLTFGSHGRFRSLMQAYFDVYLKRKKKSGCKTRLIVSERIRNSPMVKHCDVRYLPKEFDSPIATQIFGNNVSIIVWTENPIAFLIESKEAAEAFRNYFNVIWKIGKK